MKNDIRGIIVHAISGGILGPPVLGFTMTAYLLLRDTVTTPRVQWDVSLIEAAFGIFIEVVLYDLGFWCVYGFLAGSFLGALIGLFKLKLDL